MPWNVAAAITRIAALMKSADMSAKDESMVAKRIASRLPSKVSRVAARLDDRRVQVQVVRHHGGAEDADGDVEHAAVAAGSRVCGMKPTAELRRGAASRARFPRRSYPAMRTMSAIDQRLDVAEAVVLQPQER